MSLRQGITRAERALIQKAVEQKKEWKEIAPLLQDCDLPYVKQHYFTPWSKGEKSTAPRGKPIPEKKVAAPAPAPAPALAGKPTEPPKK